MWEEEIRIYGTSEVHNNFPSFIEYKYRCDSRFPRLIIIIRRDPTFFFLVDLANEQWNA